MTAAIVAAMALQGNGGGVGSFINRVQPPNPPCQGLLNNCDGEDTQVLPYRTTSPQGEEGGGTAEPVLSLSKGRYSG